MKQSLPDKDLAHISKENTNVLFSEKDSRERRKKRGTDKQKLRKAGRKRKERKGGV